nr:isoform 2 of no-associated protein 1, chloroplastic/mitochondrial [Quercus suber]
MAVATCYGCGAPLQTSDSDAPGYVDIETYELKKKHHQLRTILCGRCRLLSHGHMITAVGGNGGYSGGKQFVTAEQLREKLSHLRYEKALIVKLVDIVDFNGSFLARVRDLAGANPIILVVTKANNLHIGNISKVQISNIDLHYGWEALFLGTWGRDVYILVSKFPNLKLPIDAQSRTKK